MKTTHLSLGLLVLLTFFILSKSSGQWMTSGNNIYNTNTGNVGIGNSSPASLLYVGKYMGEPTITIRNMGAGGGATYSMVDDLSGADWKFKATTIGGFKIRDHANLMDVLTIEPNSAANSIYIKSGGYTGMGTNDPQAKLHVFDNDRALIIDGFNPINTNSFRGLGFQYYPAIGEGAITASFPGGYGFLTFHTTYGIMSERMRITYDGNVGINTTSPGAKLHVETTSGTTAIINNQEDAGNAHGLYINTTRSNTDAYILSAASGGTSRLYVRSDGRVGIGTTNPVASFEVIMEYNNYVRIGMAGNQPNYFYRREVVAAGDGQAALYAYRTRESQNNGTSYALSSSNSAIASNNFWGDEYTFGTSGFSYNDYTRTGGVLGAVVNGVYWGSLGYRNSGSTSYGGYFTSTASGAGKSVEDAMTGIGMGAWGDLMGADIHGKVYGTFIEGENYAVYAKGDIYNDKLDIHLQKNGTEMRTVLYTSTSTDVTVQTSGKAVLSGGRAVIDFDPAFAASLSSEESLVITVTPIGESNGVHLSQVTKSGFTVVENNAGKSSVTVNYIAIGKRAGYENPDLAQEVISADYNSKIARGLHADADLQTNGEGLYYENGKLVVGIHPSMLPDPNKPVEEKPVKAEVDTPVPTSVSGDAEMKNNIGMMNGR